MKTGIKYKLAGVIGLLACVANTNALADPLTYSSDRWPSRWSSVVQQAPASSQAYGYGDSQRQVQRQQNNPWVHNSSTLFDIPAADRPWGQPPRKSQRRRSRETYYRQAVVGMNHMGSMHNAYGYGAGLPGAYTQPVYSNPYTAGLTGVGMPYGVSPLLASPLLASPLVTSPLLGYPYGAHPLSTGLGRMNWPFGAW